MPDLNLFLLRYGEIGTKSSSIRKHFEDILIQNMENTFLKNDEELITEKKGMGRIFAYTSPENSHLFSRIFGLVSYSQAERLSTDLEEVKEKGKVFANKVSGSFAIRARRIGEHDFSSQDVEAEVGDAVLQENPELEVDLDDPENEFHIEIRHSDTYVFTDIKEAPGGLPVGSQGKVATYIKDERDFLAAWLIMRRGARLYVISESPKLLERLRKWDVSLKEIDLKCFNGFSSIDYPDEVMALVLGDRLEDCSEVDVDSMILRPLVGFTEDRIDRLRSRIERLEKK